MTVNVITLVRHNAPTQSTTDTTHPETIRLHCLAENALSTALYCLRSTDCDPANMRTATARAIRAATLLKRAAQVQGGAA